MELPTRLLDIRVIADASDRGARRVICVRAWPLTARLEVSPIADYALARSSQT